MRAWEDFDAYPTGDVRRFQLAQRILEDACRRLAKPLVLVASDVRAQDGGFAQFGRDGWAFFLTVSVIDGHVRASIDQLLLKECLVLGVDGSIATGGVGPTLLDAKKPLVDRLVRRVRESKGPRGAGKGQQWFGELVESWTGMWRDQAFMVLDEFVNPRRGLLWDNVTRSGEWQAARWAWLAFHSPMRDRVDMDGRRIENWELPDGHALKERVFRAPNLRFLGRKWPETRDQESYELDDDEIKRAVRILRQGPRHPLDLDPEGIPLVALQRPPGVSLQQKLMHYLLLDAKGPKMSATRIAELVGIDDPRDVRKAAKAAQARL